MAVEEDKKSSRNRTITLTEEEKEKYSKLLHVMEGPAALEEIENKTTNQDLFEVLDWLPRNCVDLLFLDPPYNLDKEFNRTVFKQRSTEAYLKWLETWFPKLLPTLKPNASVYFCGEWRSSTAIHLLLEKYLKVRNRITWEREKGRGALTNWKNCSEDIWFCTVGDEYTFNADAVKLKRRVIAPYRTESGRPKDWLETSEGNFRLTHPSNLWTDLTVPFWSMPENTDHPTQKPEKLLAKLILASTNPGALVLDRSKGLEESLQTITSKVSSPLSCSRSESNNGFKNNVPLRDGTTIETSYVLNPWQPPPLCFLNQFLERVTV